MPRKHCCKKHSRKHKHCYKKTESKKTESKYEEQKYTNQELKVSLVPFNVEVDSRAIVNGIPDSIWAMGSDIYGAATDYGKGVLVGVIDTGIDDTHPALIGKVLKRRDYVRDGRLRTAFNPHGTHVSGTIAANLSSLKGVAPKVSLNDYRVLDINGSGSFLNVTQAVYDAISDGCHILNLSLGSSTNYIPLQTAIRSAISKNIVVICAGGNEGAGKISYPAGFPEVVSVGAVQFDPVTGNLTLPRTPWFSNTNSEIDLCSDGWSVYSCIPNNRYAYYSGTSMATPHVVGLTALLRKRIQTKLGRNPTSTELIAVLRNNTVFVPSLAQTNPNLQGSGFATIYPEIPKKVNNVWILPSFSLNAP